IIEYRFRKPGKLVSMKIDEFIEELSSNSPAPGGGSVAALCGALSSSLSAMVGNLTVGKLKYKNVKEKMITISESGQELNRIFIDAIDKDTIAFNKIMDAFSLPKKDDKEKKIRDKAIKDATIEATMIPFSVLERAKDAAELALEVASSGNTNSLSDSGVAGLTSMAAAAGAYYNVLINLEGIDDQSFVEKMKKDSSEIISDVKKLTDKVSEILESALK
ncbi:MAG: cyclodeaminase/cyclohydrolase family protein, partial [Candidatus Aminicenantes bacterium]|nr:cyclodeaminase/cyclohydrolase family protein [Candidatus Aminicenantes bacterium]